MRMRQHAPQPTAPAALPGRRRWAALIVLCAGLLMVILDGTVVTVALPSIQRELGFSAADLRWVAGAYLIQLRGMLLLAGRDRAIALGIYSVIGAAGAASGLLACGILTHTLRWHWVFLGNGSIGVLTVL